MNIQILITFVILHKTNSITVYEFMDNDDVRGPSTIEVEVPVPKDKENMTICSSHKQFQSNSQTVRVYTIFGDREHRKPLLGVGFWDQNLWPEVKLDEWIELGKIPQQTDFINWVHVCIRVNFFDQQIMASINGNEDKPKTVQGIFKYSMFFIR